MAWRVLVLMMGDGAALAAWAFMPPDLFYPLAYSPPALLVVACLYFGTYGVFSYLWLHGTLTRKAIKALVVPVPGISFLVVGRLVYMNDDISTIAKGVLFLLLIHAGGILLSLIAENF